MDRITAALNRATQSKFGHLARTALYFTDPAAIETKIVTVCITDRFTQGADARGTNFNGALLEVESPMIEFLREQIAPERNAYVSVERGLVYQINELLPFDGLSVSANAIRLPQSKLRNFPYPSEALTSEVARNPAILRDQPAVLPAWMKDGW